MRYYRPTTFVSHAVARGRFLAPGLIRRHIICPRTLRATDYHLQKVTAFLDEIQKRISMDTSRVVDHVLQIVLEYRLERSASLLE